VFSVTSDLAASLSVQTAPQKPARADPSQPNDSFAALVDGNTAANAGGVPAPLPVPDRPAPQRSADDVPAAADNKPARSASSTDPAPPNNATDRTTSSNQATGSSSAANSNGSTDASQPSGSQSTTKSDGKTGSSKAETAKSSGKDSSSGASSTDPATPTPQQDAPTATVVTAVNAIAAAIPVTVAAANVAVAASASADSTPLAIAAAAIAASTSAGAAPHAPSSPLKDSSAATLAAAPLAAAPLAATTPGTTTPATATTGITVDAAVTAKASVQGAVGDAVAPPAKQLTVPTNATAASNLSLPALVEATAPVAPKTASAEASVAAEVKATTSSASDTTSSVSDRSTPAVSTTPALNNAAPQPAATAKPEAGSVLPDAAKANNSDGALLSVAATGRDRAATGGTGQTPAASSDASLQATTALQPPQPASSASTSVASTGTLSVTVATGAAVPVSGLAVEIAASVRSGKTRFEIRLDPADLGRIDVRIDVDRNGQVTSHLTVEKPETLSMLQQDAPQLQRALDDAGLKTGSGGLQFSLRDQSSSGQNSGNEAAGSAQRLVISDDDAIPAVVAGRSYGRMLAASGGVDIRV
jgi:flagellar hook-length control protein FliK